MSWLAGFRVASAAFCTLVAEFRLVGPGPGPGPGIASGIQIFFTTDHADATDRRGPALDITGNLRNKKRSLTSGFSFHPDADGMGGFAARRDSADLFECRWTPWLRTACPLKVEARTGEVGQVGQVQTRRNAMKQGTWSIVSNLANFFRSSIRNEIREPLPPRRCNSSLAQRRSSFAAVK